VRPKHVVPSLEQLEERFPDPLEELRAYAGFWKDCIKDTSLQFCVCALLASELHVLPAEVATEVKAYFRSFSAWLASLLKRGQQEGKLILRNSPRVEAESLMATVHGQCCRRALTTIPRFSGQSRIR
jgi:TetR/AcrR family transcriptional repressor of nem operon